MGKLKLLLSTDWITCRDEIMRRIAQDVSREHDGRILIVPELITHETERQLAVAAGDTASRFAEVLSFTRMVGRVADYDGCAAEKCMDNGGRIVAMAAATSQVNSALKTYASVKTKPEFLAELVNAVDEFKRCCVSPEDLTAASGKTDGILAEKLKELSLILQSYDSICSRGECDPRDQLTWLRKHLEDGKYAQEHIFYIDGFLEFSRQQMEIVQLLIEKSECVTIALNCDAVKSNHMAFEKAGQTAADLIRFAKSIHADEPPEIICGRDSVLLDISRAMFQGKMPQSEECRERLLPVRADTPFQEVQLAAQRVMELVREKKCRYRDIGIICTDMAAYQSMIQMVFHRCGLPIYVAGTDEILEKSVIATVISALNAALEGFEQRAVLRYLKSALSPLQPDICDLVENYAIMWNIHGKRWQTEWTYHPDGLGQEWTEESQSRLAELNSARKLAIAPLMQLEKDFAAAKHVAQQVESLYSFLERIELADRLDELARQLDSAGDHRGAQILNQLWDILLSAMEQLYDVLGQISWETEHFTKLFMLLLSQYNVGTIPPVLDTIMVGSVSAMRCQQVKHLLVLGASEGLLPRYGGASGLLTEQERMALRKNGILLNGSAIDGIRADFSEIYGAFCAADETIYVSYPGGQSSYVFRRLAQMAGGELQGVPMPLAAMADPREAGAYLARWNAEEISRELKVEGWYWDTKEKANFSLGSISRENVQKLYGSRLNLSASQIDRQAECRMSYFLKYGMRAKERKEATVDPAEFGSYVHAVLEKTARQVMELGGFHQVSLEQTLEFAQQYSEEYIAERFGELESERLSYLFHRNRRELEMVVTELWRELKQAQFQPKDFETAFGEGGAMPAIDIPAESMQAVLRGFVDRVDIWEQNGQHYFRVVDYKTGKKEFDYCDVFNGVGLQMLLYLFALQHNGQAVIGEKGFSAGVQYFPARAPLVTVDGYLTEEEAELARQKEWKRRGLLLRDEAVLQAMEPGEEPVRLPYTRKKDGSISGDLADREQFRLLEQYIFRWLGNMVDDIASGNVEANPYTRGTSHNACTFCPYGAVCHKGEVPGRRNYKTMTPQRFWEEVAKEVENNG